jgi:hypothetical protein
MHVNEAFLQIRNHLPGWGIHVLTRARGLGDPGDQCQIACLITLQDSNVQNRGRVTRCQDLNNDNDNASGDLEVLCKHNKL